MLLSYGASPKCQGQYPDIYLTFQSQPDFPAILKTAHSRSWLGRLLRGAERHPHGRRNELETNAGGRTDRRVPGHVRVNPVRYRRRGHGGALPDPQSRRNDSWRIYQHHSRLGTGGHDGNLYRGENLRSTPESRGDPGLCHIPEISLGKSNSVLAVAN